MYSRPKSWGQGRGLKAKAWTFEAMAIGREAKDFKHTAIEDMFYVWQPWQNR